MNSPNIEAMLRQTLDDRRLTRGEKRALNEVFDEAGLDEHALAVIRSQAFDMARQQLQDPDHQAIISWLEDITKLIARSGQEQPQAKPWSEAFFAPSEESRQRIISLLDQCARTAEVCVFTITDDKLSSALERAHSRGVKVRIITDNEKSQDLGSDIIRLDQFGIPIRIDNTPHHMHHKFAIFDRNLLLTGSYNWTRSAADNNQENYVIVNDDKLIKAFAQQFDSLWESFS